MATQKKVKLTKADIDNSVVLFLQMQEAKEKAKIAEKKFKTSEAHVLKYLGEVIHPDPTQSVTLRGAHSELELGPARDQRSVIDQVAALLKLEEVETNLGYAKITIPLKALDEYLTPDQVEELVSHSWGSRRVKGTYFE